jgi:predicted nucleic acid-binding protein
MICVDASFIIRLLTSQDSDSSYDQRWNQWQASNATIVAPTLIMYEVSNGLYRYSRAGQITSEEAEQLLERALNLGIRFYGDADLHRQALNIAIRHNLPATYDAHYLALAERLGIEFWTADQRLFNAVRSSLSWVNLVS